MGADRTYPNGSILRSSALLVSDINTIFQKNTLAMLGLPVDSHSSAVRVKWPTEGAPFNSADEDVCYIGCTTKDDPYDKIRDLFNWFPNGYGEGGVDGEPPIGWGGSGWGVAPWGGSAGRPPIPGFGGGGWGSSPWGGAPGQPNGWGNGGFGSGGWGGDGGAPTILEQWNYTRAWMVHFCIYGPNSTDNGRAIRSAFQQTDFVQALALSQLFPQSEFSAPIRAPEKIDAQWFERVDFEALVYEFVTETIERNTVKSVEVFVGESSAGQVADVNVSIP